MQRTILPSSLIYFPNGKLNQANLPMEITSIALIKLLIVIMIKNIINHGYNSKVIFKFDLNITELHIPSVAA